MFYLAQIMQITMGLTNSQNNNNIIKNARNRVTPESEEPHRTSKGAKANSVGKLNQKKYAELSTYSNIRQISVNNSRNLHLAHEYMSNHSFQGTDIAKN